MCSMSAVSDYYMQTYPYRQGQQWPGQLNPVPMNPTQIIQSMDPEVKDMLRKAIALLDKIDKKLGDVECMDDKKAAFLEALGPA